MIGIYRVINPNNKIYIGQSIDIEKRWKRYYYTLNCKSQTALYRSFKKHGVDNHKFEVIEECLEQDLNERERYWQDYYDVSNKNGLNCMLTGCGDKKGKISKETRFKMSECKRGAKHGMYGRKKSKEAILKRLEKYDVKNNYNYRPILNTENGFFYDTLQEAADSIGMNKKNLFNKLSGAQKNYTYLVRT